MTGTEALTVVAQACARMTGTLAEHQTVQEALGVLRLELEPAGEPEAD